MHAVDFYHLKKNQKKLGFPTLAHEKRAKYKKTLTLITSTMLQHRQQKMQI